MPDGFVHLEGPVTIDDDPASSRPWSRQISAEYVPFDEVDAHTDRNAVEGELLVRLTPETIVAVADLAGWDRRSLRARAGMRPHMHPGARRPGARRHDHVATVRLVPESPTTRRDAP